ncbi:MAG: tyrosine-protein phosphatase [Oligoflexales bacterium]|nr:tyrosine-protein phosphatase [Oligoflexales bacterium]
MRKIKILALVLILSFLSFLKAGEGFSDENRLDPIYSLNLGLVINNAQYKIYRSAKLGKSGLYDLRSRLWKNNLPFPKTIIYMNKEGYNSFSNFAVEEYEMSFVWGYTFYHSFGPMRTYVDGQNPYDPSTDIDNTQNLGYEAQAYFSLRNDGVDGGIDSFFNILRIILEPKNQPVLFHCLGGLHRTGMVAMALRYLQGGNWINGPKKDGLNPAQYEYHKYNPFLFRPENIEFIEMLANDPRFQELQDTYRLKLQE